MTSAGSAEGGGFLSSRVAQTGPVTYRHAAVPGNTALILSKEESGQTQIKVTCYYLNILLRSFLLA
jgi:hypothetical protein